MLFADLKGPMELLAGRDPDEARNVMQAMKGESLAEVATMAARLSVAP